MRHGPVFLAMLILLGSAASCHLASKPSGGGSRPTEGIRLRAFLQPDLSRLPAGYALDADTAARIRQILNDRVNAFGLSGATVASEGTDQFVVEIPASPPKLFSRSSGNLIFPLRPGANVIGSGPEATIKLTDQKVPARQATITFDGGTVRLKVETPGVRDDDRDLAVGESRDLKDGSRVRFGDTTLMLLIPAHPMEILKQLTRTAQLELVWFRAVKSEKNPTGKYEMREEPSPTEPRRTVYTFKDAKTGKPVPARQVIEESQKIVTGADFLPRFRQEFDPNAGGIVVAFELSDNGTAAFGEFTRNHVGDTLAVVLDGDVLTAPRIRDSILGGKGIIAGSFNNVAEARALAQLLNGGALPVPLKILRTEAIGAAPGQDG
jgi:preprotein translocase subunit SecD